MNHIKDQYPIAMSFRPITLLIARCQTDDDAKAQHCFINVQAMCKVRPREECDKSNRRAWELCRLRLRQERHHVEILRDRYLELDSITGRTLVTCCNIELDELAGAIKRAQPLPSEREVYSEAESLAVPIPELPAVAESTPARPTIVGTLDLDDID